MEYCNREKIEIEVDLSHFIDDQNGEFALIKTKMGRGASSNVSLSRLKLPILGPRMYIANKDDIPPVPWTTIPPAQS